MKRIIVLLLVFVIIFGISACGKNNNATDTNTSKVTSTTENQEDIPNTDTTIDSSIPNTNNITEADSQTQKPTESTTHKKSDTTTHQKAETKIDFSETTPPTSKPAETDNKGNCKHVNSRRSNCINDGYCWDCSSIIEEINPSRHPEGQEPGLYNEKKATCNEKGYTGDWKCLSCHAVVTKGKEIPKTTTHTGGKASCSAVAKCEICGIDYGEKDNNNHTRADGKVNWETRNKRAATCEDGYSGDIYCLDCGKIVSKGKVVAAIGCVSEDAIPATCCTYRSCGRCGKVWEWMGYDNNNHTGKTEIRNAQKATCCKGYSGDVYCLACNKIKTKGTDIAPIREHSWNLLSAGMYKCTECGAVEIRVGS